ncbi:MAG TPA: RidA family protein [Gemmatimonadales bacterium]|jgi:reactive intermediate/imine deaminase|nr:RidA family protein [Gemmatimonadales bacterium]
MSAAPDVEYFPIPGNSRLPFSEAVRVGSMLYLAGQMGTDANGKIVAGGIENETRQALANMRTVLERHGSSLNHVVRITCMLADMSEWSTMNAVYVTHFPEHLPARSAFGASGLALGGRVEFECTATVGQV